MIEPLETGQSDRIEALLKENQRLLVDNNKFLRQMRRTAILSSVFRLVWVLFFLVSLAYLYFAYIQPNLQDIKTDLNIMREMTPTSDSLRQLYELIKAKEVSS